MTIPDQFKDQLRNELAQDFCPLSFFVAEVRETLGIGEPEAARAVVLELLREFIASGFAVVGNPGVQPREFVPWQGPVDEVVARISEEWAAIGRPLHGFDVAWLIARARVPSLQELPGGQ